jgi:hypothetical protein
VYYEIFEKMSDLAGLCKTVMEFRFLKYEEFLDQLSDVQFLKKKSVPLVNYHFFTFYSVRVKILKLKLAKSCQYCCKYDKAFS